MSLTEKQVGALSLSVQNRILQQEQNGIRIAEVKLLLNILLQLQAEYGYMLNARLEQLEDLGYKKLIAIEAKKIIG